MRSEKLDIAHKELLYDRLRAIATPIAEYSFPNIYLFREAHNYEVVFDREIFIKGNTYDGLTYLMPSRDIREIDQDYLREMMRSVDFLFPIPEPWIEAFDPEYFEFTQKQGDMDYIYTVEKMSTYKGRNLHQKRSQLRQFIAGYSHESFPLTSERKADAFLILNEWQTESELDETKTDYYPCKEALTMSEDLVLCGGIYYADNEPAGFILGEDSDPETFVLHFAKARKKFKGVYQFMFNNFAKVLPIKYRYMNFEQDLDKDTLRIAKSSYQPDRMLKKIRVGIRK